MKESSKKEFPSGTDGRDMAEAARRKKEQAKSQSS